MKDSMFESVDTARLAIELTVGIRKLFHKGMLTPCGDLIVSRIVCKTNNFNGIEILLPYRLGNVSVPFKIRTEGEFFIISAGKIAPSSLCPTVASKVLGWFDELEQKMPCQRNGNSIMVPRLLLGCSTMMSDVPLRDGTINE